MNTPLLIIDRKTKEQKKEKIYFEKTLRFLYGSRVGALLEKAVAHLPLFSHFFGWWQRTPFSKGKIHSFVKHYEIDVSEFALPLSAFSSFDAFFTRNLKESARPIVQDPKVAVFPADGRYLFFQNINQSDGFLVKGEKFSLAELVQDAPLAERYAHGTMVLARLCPTDYHRFHFPCDCFAGPAKLIKGPLHSVNPISIKQQIQRLAQNKRMLTLLKSDVFGNILFIEIGATNVGSIKQTYTSNRFYKKGDEKGYFSFGGSSIILLFEPNKITIDSDLLVNASQYIETLCRMGESMGKIIF